MYSFVAVGFPDLVDTNLPQLIMVYFSQKINMQLFFNYCRNVNEPPFYGCNHLSRKSSGFCSKYATQNSENDVKS